jgi:hypothetical protein
VDGHACDIVSTDFDLTGVQTRSKVDAQRPNGVSDRTGTLDRATGTIKGGGEAVPGGFDLASPEPLKLAACGLVMRVKKITPPLVAQVRRSIGRRDDVGEQDRGEHAVRFSRVPRAGQELLDLVDQGVAVAGVDQVVLAWELDELGPGDVLRQVAGVVRTNEEVA